MHKRATPLEAMKYKHTLELNKLYNKIDQGEDWIDLNLQQIFNARYKNVILIDSSLLRVGKTF